MAENQPEAEQGDGVFVEIDESDPFVGLSIRIHTEDGETINGPGIGVGAGRYELKKVDSDTEAGSDR